MSQCHRQPSAWIDLRWRRGLCVLGLMFLAGQLVAYAALACRLRIEYWDGYEYLGNAKWFAGFPVWYWDFRPPILPILCSPSLTLGVPAHPWETSLLGPSLTMFFVAALTQIVLYRVFRLSFGSALSLLGVVLFSMNRLFVHYRPFAMTEVPTAMFVALAYLAYERARRTDAWGDQLLAGVCLALPMLTNYTAGLVVPGFVVCEIVRLSGRRVPFWRSRHWWAIMGVAFGIFYASHVLIFHVAREMGLRALYHIVIVFREQFAANTGTEEPWWEYLPELLRACSAPVLAAGVAGVLIGLRRRGARDVLFGSSLATFFVVQTFAISHKESRYLFFMLPSFYYFVLVALREAGTWVANRTSPGRSMLVCTIGVAAVTLGAGPGAFREWRAFRDPIYTEPFQQSVCAHIGSSLSAGGRLFWLGTGYAQYPAEYRSAPWDEFYYFYHLGQPGSHFYTHRLVAPMTEDEPKLRDGDVLAVSTPVHQDAMHVLERVPPLRVMRVEVHEFAPSGTPGEFRNMRTSDRLRLNVENGKWVVRCSREFGEGFLAVVLSDAGAWLDVGNVDLSPRPIVLPEQVAASGEVRGFLFVRIFAKDFAYRPFGASAEAQMQVGWLSSERLEKMVRDR